MLTDLFSLYECLVEPSNVNTYSLLINFNRFMCGIDFINSVVYIVLENYGK